MVDHTTKQKQKGFWYSTKLLLPFSQTCNHFKLYSFNKLHILLIYLSISSLQDSFVEEIKECKSAMSQGSSASQHRKKHAELQERVQGLWNMVNLFEKAILLFEG